MTDNLKSSPFFARIHDLPLKYRLSIAFFVLAFLGTSSLVLLALLSQNDLIRQEERERLYGYQAAMEHNLDLEGRWAVSLASSFARNPEIALALANKDRLRLVELCYPAYIFMKNQYGVSQFNFHILPPRNFLRMQRLYEFGDDLSYRQTILDTVFRQTETFGLEAGLTGYGIRGVAPIFHQGNLVGTVEIGFSLGTGFLVEMKKQFGIEASFLTSGADETTFESYSTTLPENFERTDPLYARVFHSGTPELMIREVSGVPYAVLVGTVQNYKKETAALVEFGVDRTKTLAVIDHYRNLMLGIGILGMLLSVGGIYIISGYFTHPIARMVTLAREIALGMSVQPMQVRPSGELGVLAEALDDMLMSLEESRTQIQDYTDNLENMILLRTRALRESEEKYRTLVESIPLVVYRLLGEGKTVFINHFIEDLTGIPVRQVLESPGFWKEKVWEEDRLRVWPLMDRCLAEGREFKAEYRIRHTNGTMCFVLDHALPVLDEKGTVETVDGFLVNVTDRHQLQQQIIQTEELRTLTEVSARLAHEIRNPLVAAGGFARRLMQSLIEGDPCRDKAQIIVQEIARLEKILGTTLAYLKPFEINRERASLDEVIKQVLDEYHEEFDKHSVTVEKSLSKQLPAVSLDQELFKKVLENILQALLGYCSPGSRLEVRTYVGESVLHLEIAVLGVHVSEDDVEHFFYPFTSRADSTGSLDLPVAKMIIHKHQGLIDLRRKDSNQLLLNISLPQ